MTGEVGILNVGAGDVKLSFDPKNPAERIRAARIVKDMLRRGYALLIATGETEDGEPIYTRADDFDENTCEYIIADFDPLAETKASASEERAHEPVETTEAAAESPTKRPRGRPRKTTRIQAASTSAIAVSRSAGG